MVQPVHPSWENVMEGVWVSQVDSRGPTVGILGGVHGHEPTGSQAVRGLIRQEPTNESGTVIAMLGNLRAEGRAKCVDTDLNRCFRDLTAEEQERDPKSLPYEVRRAQLLRTALDECVSVIDVHNTTDELRFDNTTEPGWLIICERNGLSTARKIGAPVVSFGWSTTEPGGSDGYMASKGKEGLCFESGQKDDLKRNLARAHGAIERYLCAYKLREGSPLPLFDGEPVLVETDVAHIRIGESFSLAREFRNFEQLRAGEPVATDGDEAIFAEKDHVIIFPHADPPIGTEAFTLGRIVKA